MTVIGGLKTRQKEVGFQVMVGAAQKKLHSLDAGAVGAILAFACCAPTACYEVYAGVEENGARSRSEKQERIVGSGQEYCRRTEYRGRVKYAMDYNGYFGGTAAAVVAADGGEESRDRALMENIKN